MRKYTVRLLTYLLLGFFYSANVYAEETYMLGDPWSHIAITPSQSKQIFSPAGSTAETSSYSYGDPTVSEQVHLEEINRARTNPLAEATLHGVALNEGLPAGTISSDPAQPLVMNEWLTLSARNHSQDMLDNNFFAHNSQDGTTPFERMIAAGFDYSSAGENLAWRGSTGFIDEISTVIQMHADLYIDEYVSSRGHRINIFDRSFKEIGLGVKGGPYTYNSTTYNYSFMLTCDFGASSDYSESFILGVVYDDDGDSVYEAGEGVGDIEIRAYKDGSVDAETTSASAGGYGIPVSNGTYAVRALETETKYAEKTVVVNSLNKKIDFLKSEFVEHGPPPPTPGDFDGDGDVDLADAISGLQIMVNDNTVAVTFEADINGDGLIGLADVIFVLTTLSK